MLQPTAGFGPSTFLDVANWASNSLHVVVDASEAHGALAAMIGRVFVAFVGWGEHDSLSDPGTSPERVWLGILGLGVPCYPSLEVPLVRTAVDLALRGFPYRTKQFGSPTSNNRGR